MSQRVKTLVEMHSEHRRWKSEISMWQDDINEWKLQMQLALETLEQFEALIRREKTEVDRHSGALSDISTNLEKHEKSIARNMRTGTATDLGAELASGHDSRTESFEAQSKTHRRLKKKHHEAMARAAALESVLKNAETG